MECPKCGHQLPDDFLEKNFNGDYYDHCGECGKEFSLKFIRQYMEPTDCLCVREGDIPADDFDDDFYQDCHANCALASQENDCDLVQDEEGNWCYPDDLDEDGRLL